MLPINQTKEETDEKNSMISWDARQGRSKLLLNILTITLNYRQMEDYNNWLKSLQNLHWLCFSYVKKSDSEKVKTKIAEIFHHIQQGRYNNALVKHRLCELTELILYTYRNQFMQVQVEDESDFNPEKVLGFKK